MPQVTDEPEILGNKPEAKPPKKKHSIITIIFLALLFVVGAGILAVQYVLLSPSGIGTALAGCTKSEDLAAKATPQLKAKLEGIHIIDGGSSTVFASTSGDCVDSDRHSANARVTYPIADSPLLALEQTIRTKLSQQGYHPKSNLLLHPVLGTNSDVITSESYLDDNQGELDIDYVILSDPNSCEAAHQRGEGYSECITAYDASFNDFSQLKVTSVTASLQTDFLNR